MFLPTLAPERAQVLDSQTRGECARFARTIPVLSPPFIALTLSILVQSIVLVRYIARLGYIVVPHPFASRAHRGQTLLFVSVVIGHTMSVTPIACPEI